MMRLTRRLDRIDALAVSLGAVIGVGVFFSTGKVLAGAGGFAGATAVWLVVGVVCLAGAVLYADLSARVPEAGGPYAYVRVAFGPPAGFVYGWLNAALAIPVRQASSFAVIGIVLARWLPGDPRLLASTVLVLLTGLNLLGVRAGAIAQRVFTGGKLITLAIVIVLAIVLAMSGPVATPVTVAPLSFAIAVSAAWYAYLAWQDAVLLAEELHEPRRDLPVVLISTVVVTIVLYLGVHAAVYVGLGGGNEAYGESPAITVAARALGTFGAALLSVLMLSSMIGGVAEGLMVRPRIAMALARDGMAPAPLAAVSRTGAPYGALLVHACLTLLWVSTNSFSAILPVLGFSQGVLGVFETASYFVVRRKCPEVPTSRFHPWAPLVFIIANLALCVISGVDAPRMAGIALGLLAAIAVVYAIVRPRSLARDAGVAPAGPLPPP